MEDAQKIRQEKADSALTQIAAFVNRIARTTETGKITFVLPYKAGRMIGMTPIAESYIQL